MQAIWLYSTEVPGMKVLVLRGWWGRLMKPPDFATAHEVKVYMKFLTALNRRRFSDG